MKLKTLGGAAAAAGAALFLATAAISATAVQKVQVALGGEAGQPMTIKLDQTDIKAGLVEFAVKNEAAGTDHEVVLVKLSSALARWPLRKK